MEFQKPDLIQVDNLIKILKRGQYTLDGLEVIAMSDCMKWLNKLQTSVTQEIQSKDAKQAELEKK